MVDQQPDIDYTYGSDKGCMRVAKVSSGPQTRHASALLLFNINFSSDLLSLKTGEVLLGVSGFLTIIDDLLKVFCYSSVFDQLYWKFD